MKFHQLICDFFLPTRNGVSGDSSVYSIVNEEPNAEEAKAKVKAYEEANRSQIVIRQSQRADEERCVADR